MKSFERRYPCVPDMQKTARRRLPGFMRDYLECGLGEGLALKNNRDSLQSVRLVPQYQTENDQPDMATRIFGQEFSAPFGIAPMGLAGLIWPDSETGIAEAAVNCGIGHVLSTYSNKPMEEMAKITGPAGWYQHYPPNDPAIEDDMIARAKKAGYKVLVVTVDIPGPTRREHDIRSGMAIPPVITLPILGQVLAHPGWALGTLVHGIPDFGNLSPYYPQGASLKASADFIGTIMQGHISQMRFTRIRQSWDGPIVVKGVLHPDDAKRYLASGADAIIVSNHGGRQFDAAPSAIDMLPAMRKALGPEALIMADGGIRSGLDVLRMLAMGADFCLIGRPFLYAAIAMGRAGPSHLVDVLKAEMSTSMAQLGALRLTDLPSFLGARPG